MREAITAELVAMEQARTVRTLLAIESGSRAWGFASNDSDYDVRAVYVRPMREYLRLDSGRDNIEWRLDATFDVEGWDITKFLRLMRGSNPSVFEWLSSPIVYAESPDFAQVRELAPACFSPKASTFHYLGMARGHDAKYLKSEKVLAKKYLYLVRATLAARWCLDERSPAPMLVSDLVAAKLPPQLHACYEQLLAAKLSGSEGSVVAHMPELDLWLAAEDSELYARARAEQAPEKLPWDALNEVFWRLLTP